MGRQVPSGRVVELMEGKEPQEDLVVVAHQEVVEVEGPMAENIDPLIQLDCGR